MIITCNAKTPLEMRNEIIAYLEEQSTKARDLEASALGRKHKNFQSGSASALENASDFIKSWQLNY